MLHPQLREDAARMRMLLYGQLVSKAVCTAVELGLPEALAGGPRSAEDLAGDVDAHPSPCAGCSAPSSPSTCSPKHPTAPLR